MSGDIDDIQDHRYRMRRRTVFLTQAKMYNGYYVSGFAWAWMTLTCSESFPEHVPRTSARAQTCARGPGGLAACHGAESTRIDPRPEEKKMPKCLKNIFIHSMIYIHGNILFLDKVYFTLNHMYTMIPLVLNNTTLLVSSYMLLCVKSYIRDTILF